ncbi:hypothetical protein NP603_12330 [Methylomonas sp. SURF-1]|uniref:Uncharacterized protein n=1 Tax=Methylomonas aurea TaxID=2952224 RepID=A0ABT1UI30_9GAMM|nr:hypothetical protein [Methylomonas sp. SURF-1]MCQ8181897.1 hypothetical protein [Methylomonas sp. SURF-1]
MSRNIKSHLISLAALLVSSMGYATDNSHFSGVYTGAAEWTDWNTAETGNPGKAHGILRSTRTIVDYFGEVYGEINHPPVDNNVASTYTNGKFWGWVPEASFNVVDSLNTPDSVGDIILIQGNFPQENKIVFSEPVLNPYIAIWSLGNITNPGPDSFTFNLKPELVVGGPANAAQGNYVFAGSESITVNGNTVYGVEGNGIVQFHGLVKEISWTDSAEGNNGIGGNYGFTVGSVKLSKNDCKKNGWQNYGIFKNQGDCISFVTTHFKNQPANEIQ